MMQNAMVEGFRVELLAVGTDTVMNVVGASCESLCLPGELCV